MKGVAGSKGTKGRILRETNRLLAAGVAGHVFPGGVACFAFRDADRWEYTTTAQGLLGRGLTRVAIDSPYDLASITKSFVATTALRMVEADSIDLDLRLSDGLNELRNVVVDPTLEELLAHRSGLAAWGGLFLDVPHDPGSSAAHRWIIAEAARRRGDAGPGKCEYSDLGYMLAGEIIGRYDRHGLAHAVRTRVTEPLGIADDVYYGAALPPDRHAKLALEAPPTESCDWRGRLVRGEVHDENCHALGGVGGHAGLFGTAHGVARFATTLLDVVAGRSDFLKSKTMEAALRSRGEDGSYRMGFDVKSGERASAGRRMGPRTFGHLGFTGTSYWCDPDLDVAIVLLTNRVHPSRANVKIKGFRPAFHDGLMAAFTAP